MRTLNIILFIGLVIPFMSCTENTLSLVDKDFKLKRYEIANDRIIKYMNSNEFGNSIMKSEWYFLYGLSEFFFRKLSKISKVI